MIFLKSHVGSVLVSQTDWAKNTPSVREGLKKKMGILG